MSLLPPAEDALKRQLDASGEIGPTRRDLEIKEKKARLYDLKNKLLKYDSFDELPIEELQTLCENLHFQRTSEASNSEEEIERHAQEHGAVRGATELVQGVREGGCGKAYVVKMKEVMVIVLVIVCILVKTNSPASTTYDMGDFSIYQTRYQRSLFRSKDKEPAEEGSKFLQKWLGVEPEEHVKLYLPKGLEKVRRKDQREITYQTCIDSFSDVCIDHRLSLYGSMNLELEDWIQAHLTGTERVAFQLNTDYVLSIVLSALRVKQLREEGRAAGVVTLVQSEGLSGVELNSIKLSLIENECLNFVEIIRVERQDYSKLAGFQVVVASQEFYVYYAHPIAKSMAEAYPRTSFLVYMAHGVNDTLKILLKQQLAEREVYEIKFSYRDNAFYVQERLREVDLVFLQHEKRFRMFLLSPKQTKELVNGELPLQAGTHAVNSPKALNALPATLSPQNGSSETQQVRQVPPVSVESSAPPKAGPRELVLQQHPCIQEYKYDILPILSFFDKFVYIDTVVGYKLLVSLERAEQYKQKGAISPELLFFISQNVKPSDVVFFAYQLYHDELILLTLAKTVAQHDNFYCVAADTDHPVLTENLRMNGALDMVSYAYISMEETDRIRQFYREHDFTVFFTTFGLLSRDYKFIFDEEKAKVVIFYWVVDINFLDFVKGLTRKHRVWAILERFEKMSFMDSCMNYGLMEVNEDSVLQMDRSWLVVQM